MSENRVAALLRDRAGVGTLLSEREAAKRCDVSPTTISKLMRGETRHIRRSNLDKIADGLGLPRELLERAALADAGYIQAASGSTVAEALALIQGLSRHDRAVVLGALAEMERQAAADQEMRESAGSGE